MSRNFVLNTGNGVSLFVSSNQDVGFHTFAPSEKLAFESGNAKFGSNVFVMQALGVGTSNPSHDLHVAGSARVTGDMRVGGALSVGDPLIFNGFYVQKASNIYGTTAISAAVENISVNTLGTSFYLVEPAQRFSFGVTSNTNLLTINGAGPIVAHTHILPSSNVTFDLGSSNMRFRDLYLSGNTIHMDGLNISKNETGDLTLTDTESGKPKALVVKELYLDNGECNTYKICRDDASGGIRFVCKHPNSNETEAHMHIPNLFPMNNNIGIGISAPQARLHVSDDAVIKVAKIGSYPNDINYAMFSHCNQASTTSYALLQSSNGETCVNAAAGRAVKLRINNTDAMTVAANGNVGIGTTNPSFTLDVMGNIYASGAITAFSDKRMKDNVLPIVNALETIEQLNGISYTRKDYERLAEPKGTRHVGMLAQDVKRILPESVTYDAFNDKYGINYGSIVAVLVEGVKELRADYLSRIYELERQVAKLSK